ncbi:MAG: DUF885 domain-containing protein [Bacteroidia bacterium]|nr:DUF885 domain-containing protein [Bacteroidia bacterium]
MRSFIPLCFLLLLFSCSDRSAKTKNENIENQSFERYKQQFVEELWKLYPGWASSIGYHKYDSVLTIPDEAQRLREKVFNNANLDSLKRFKTDELSDQNKTDLLMLRDFLNSSLWGTQTLKAWQWDPSNYNVCGGFSEMLSNNYDSLDERLRNFYIRMKNVPAYYEAAKSNISNPTIEHTELAIKQNMGGISIFEAELQSVLEESHLSNTEKNQITERAKSCAKAVTDYADWLKKLKNNNPKSFRLGKELYAKKFEYEIQSGYSADQIYEKALAHKKELHSKMFAITKDLWRKYFKEKKMPADSLAAIREMINVLSLNHVKPDSFQSSIEKQIPELVSFVNRKNLIYLDPKKPLVVRKEPAYMSGLAGASISSPGPYDVNGNTYYNVGSLSGWSKEKAESYLREYNHYILQILNIHEAIPGHYTQLIYSNNSALGASTYTFLSGHDSIYSAADSSKELVSEIPAAHIKEGTLKSASMDNPLPGIIKSILGNGAMVEGWAVYSELMMLENGYGASAGANTADPEMWLMYYKWNLRSTCNTILDYGVHVKNMTKNEALHLLTKEAFQQDAEAEGKWRRVTLSQVQLCSYFTGFKEIYEFRVELKKEMGEGFDLKRFHEKFLSYGSAPVKYIKELMRAEHFSSASSAH